MPLFVGTPPEQLPATDQRIRYLYYLANIKLEGTEEKDSEIIGVLKALMPPDTVYKLDIQANALLIMGIAQDIKSVMNIITQLDRPGFQESMDVIPLHYANAQIVSDLFNKQILGGDTSRYRLDTKKSSDATYFSRHIRIIPFDRANSLIVVGRAQAINRMRTFIEQYIDVKPESGKSILHTYQLQYLKSKDFAEVLKNVIESRSTGGTEQAEGEKKKGTGPQRFFEGVIIATDDPGAQEEDVNVTQDTTNANSKAQLPPPSYYGGNNLIIAATSDDWKRIKELIEHLDQPQPQVLIEVLIADLTLDDTRALGTMFRNPAKLPLPNQMNFQVGMLNPGGTPQNPGIIPDSFNDPSTIGAIPNGPVADVSRLWQFVNGIPMDATSADAGVTSVENQLNSPVPGSTVLTLNDNDGATWGIAQILKVLDHNRILSHPHVISRDNQIAEIENTEIRRLSAEAIPGTGGAITRKEVDVPASLKVKIRPRISVGDPSLHREGTVGLQVLIDINEFQGSTETRTVRNVTTNATMRTGDMLAIGGLIRTRDIDVITETPVLSKIPIIGWLFKRKGKTQQRTNLTVFIMPTIIEPRLRGGIGDYTSDYLKLTKQYASGNLFDALKDPITRWFFGSGKSLTDSFADEFTAHDEVHTQYGKHPGMPNRRVKNNKKTYMPEDEIFTAQKKEQAKQIRNMIKDLANPFEKIEVAKSE